MNYSLTDYVVWCGDRPFEEKPFSTNDALVLSDVVYFDLFRDGCEGKTLRELIDASAVDDPDLVKRLGGGMREHVPFIRAVAASERFGTLTVPAKHESFDPEKSIQFCAAVFRRAGLFNFIAFRGTDDSIAGWKEDFMISFTKTDAQRLAVNFAAANVDSFTDNYIAGHSKGANLALYASAMLPDALWRYVTRTYVLDGPGFCREVLDLSLLDRIESKTLRIIPEYSTVGKLFEPKLRNTLVVKSSETAVMQHELLSWLVTPEGPAEAGRNDPRSEEINGVIKNWIEDVTQPEREKFVNELFGALSATGAETMTEFTKKGIDGFDDVLFRLIGSSNETKKTAASLPGKLLFGNFFRKAHESGFIEALRTDESVQAFLLIVAGIATALTSGFILEAVSAVLFAFFTVLQAALTVRKLHLSGWKFSAVRDRIYINIILFVICVCLFFKDGALFLIGSGIFSTAALVLGVQASVRVAAPGLPLHRRILFVCEIVACAVLGVAFLVIPQQSVFILALTSGAVLAADGIARIIFLIAESKKR